MATVVEVVNIHGSCSSAHCRRQYEQHDRNRVVASTTAVLLLYTCPPWAVSTAVSRSSCSGTIFHSRRPTILCPSPFTQFFCLFRWQGSRNGCSSIGSAASKYHIQDISQDYGKASVFSRVSPISDFCYSCYVGWAFLNFQRAILTCMLVCK